MPRWLLLLLRPLPGAVLKWPPLDRGDLGIPTAARADGCNFNFRLHFKCVSVMLGCEQGEERARIEAVAGEIKCKRRVQESGVRVRAARVLAVSCAPSEAFCEAVETAEKGSMRAPALCCVGAKSLGTLLGSLLGLCELLSTRGS